YSSSGYWSWSGPSDQSNPSTPSPPLSADSFKLFRMPSINGPPPDDTVDEQDGSSLLFDEPIPRKRKVGRQRNCDSDCSDGEEDFYYSEIKLNTDSVADGLSSLSPVSPSVLSPVPPPHDRHRRPPAEGSKGSSGNKENHSHAHSNTTPLSRSAPSALYLIHTDHAYQATSPVTIPSTGSGSDSGPDSAASNSFTLSSLSHSRSDPELWGAAAPDHSSPLLPSQSHWLTQSRGEGKKCRKVYGMENRDMWCTACRWKKACQRFTD
ncbi:unnamed protein product, partial [Coregonus sp. 'balchen']